MGILSKIHNAFAYHPAPMSYEEYERRVLRMKNYLIDNGYAQYDSYFRTINVDGKMYLTVNTIAIYGQESQELSRWEL